MNSLNSLTFLLLRQSKNRLLELKAKPSKLIVYIIGIAFLGYILVSAMGMEVPEAIDTIDVSFFKGILVAFFMFSFIVTLIPAFQRGATLFEMEDANFLFVAPIKPRTVLLYGLVKTAKTVILGSLFMIFQVQWMRASFGIGLGGMLLATLGYILVTLVCQTLTLFIYAFTNGNPRRKRLATLIIVAVFVPAVIVFLNGFIAEGSIMYALHGLLASPVLDFIPIVGWASAGIAAMLFGEMLVGAFFLGMLVIAGIVFFGAVFIGNPEYYEDVLGATESAFEAVRAAKEDGAAAIGNMASSNKPVKLKATGINAGAGASTFFYKHVRESFRANWLGLWGFTSLFILAGAIFWSGMWAHGSQHPYHTASSDSHMLRLLLSLAGIKLFTAGFGRGLLETYNHYIYLVPDPPFKKWVWANFESMFKVAVEALLIFGISGVIVGAPVWVIVASIVASIVFVFYYLGINLAFLRITDVKMNTVILIVVYFAVVLIPLAPGVAAGVFVFMQVSGAVAGLAMTLALVTVSAWMLLVGAGCFALSKGALHNCDMPTI